jgi:hypothetical protein
VTPPQVQLEALGTVNLAGLDTGRLYTSYFRSDRRDKDLQENSGRSAPCSASFETRLPPPLAQFRPPSPTLSAAPSQRSSLLQLQQPLLLVLLGVASQRIWQQAPQLCMMEQLASCLWTQPHEQQQPSRLSSSITGFCSTS